MIARMRIRIRISDVAIDSFGWLSFTKQQTFRSLKRLLQLFARHGHSPSTDKMLTI
jgi:hypothetical protein